MFYGRKASRSCYRSRQQLEFVSQTVKDCRPAGRAVGVVFKGPGTPTESCTRVLIYEKTTTEIKPYFTSKDLRGVVPIYPGVKV